MLFSSLLVVAAVLPFGLAAPSVVTVTIYDCESSLSSGYAIPEETSTPGSGSPDYGGYGGQDSTSSCTESEGYGGSGGYGSGGYTATTGYGASYTHSSYSNNSSTANSNSNSIPASSTPTKTTATFVPGCTNTADNRAAWCDGYSIDSNLDTQWPTTGKIRTYNLEITNTTLAPDGFERLVLAVNGQYPGPTIEADWGDTLQITVKNSLQNNGTSIHWHGLRQLNSNNMDGTNGVTECPIAPGYTKTYTFQAVQHGTSWYHSHYSTQYGDGVLGAIQINGPATENYDEDLGTYPITEWYHTTVFQNVLYSTYNGGSQPIADNGLINGHMLSADGKSGSYSKTTLEKGKKYRLRLINTSVDNHFKVSLDGHPFSVITSDFVPIKPYTTDWLFLAIGQRYDVIITASEAVSNYWFRAEVQIECSAQNLNNGNIKSIFSYAGAAAKNPTSQPTAYEDNCVDESNLVPHVAKAVPKAAFDADVQSLQTDLGSGTDSTGAQIVQWTINGTPMNVDWDTPTLKYVANSETTFPTDLNVFKMPNKGQWYYWIVQGSDVPNSHPIHLHGHDFSLLGTGPNVFDTSQTGTLDFTNPPRRDVAMLPAGGWLAIAFEADNPGAWLLHCHIAWHVSQGFAAQFLEQEAAIATTMNLNTLADTCDGWGKYQTVMKYPKDDSGLR